MTQQLKVVLPGGAGLVGQNLVARLKGAGHKDIVVLDKHQKNLEILKRVQPDINVHYADLAVPGASLTSRFLRHRRGPDSEKPTTMY